MAVSALTKTFGGTTVEITEESYKKLVAKGEQLRILKNFVALEDVICKNQIETLIKAMEVEQ